MEAARSKSTAKGCGIGCLCLLGLAVLIAIMLNPSSSPERTKERDASMAQIKAERFVRTTLRAPSTAKFSGSSVVEQGNGVFVVRGAVDAQNAFGAMLRKNYVCRVQRTGDEWTPLEPCGLME
jgi:hypothetical protein